MKRIIISIVLLATGITIGFISFNHVDPWLGLLITIITIGLFLNYSYKQIKKMTNEQK